MSARVTLVVLIGVLAACMVGVRPQPHLRVAPTRPHGTDGATIRAEFVDEDGVALNDVAVRVQGWGGQAIGQPVLSRGDGQLRWHAALGITERRHVTVEATHAGCSSARWQVWIARGRDLDLGTITLAPPGTVRGRLVDAAGDTLVQGWGVCGVVEYAGRDRLPDRRDGTIDQTTGEFRFENVPVGVITICAVQGPLYLHTAVSASIQVNSGAETYALVDCEGED